MTATNAIYGRDRRTSIRFFWIAVAICAVATTVFFVRTGFASSQQYSVPANSYLVLVAGIVVFAVGSGIANAYFEGGVAISALNVAAIALAFGLATFFSSVTGADIGADAPPVSVFATFIGIAVIGGSIAWGVGNILRALKNGSDHP